jgi:hypothetical protein
MKRFLPVLCVAMVVLGGFLVVSERDDVREARVRAAAAAKARDRLAVQVDQQKQRTRQLQTELRDTKAQALATEMEAHHLKQELTRPQTNENKNTGPAKLFRDPDMKAALQSEAKIAAAKSAQALVDAGLARELKLDGDQSAALKQLLTERASIMWDQVLVPMTTGDLDQAGMTAAGEGANQALSENAAQIRAFLGEDGFNTYRWFEKTQTDREQVNQLAPEFSQAGQALNDEQRAQLLSVMIDERTHFAFQYNFDDPTQIDYAHWHENLTEERMNTFFQETSQLNERILQRAQTVLTAEQTTLLKDFMNQQLQRAKFTVRTTMALMGQAR